LRYLLYGRDGSSHDGLLRRDVFLLSHDDTLTNVFFSLLTFELTPVYS